MIVLGIDPGSRHTGYGVIDLDLNRVVEYGVMNVAELGDQHLRLLEIYNRVADVIRRTLPDECAIEMPVYGRDAQAMLKLGRAQAAAILASLNSGLPVAQYTPKEVKKSVTGNGAAAKEQVRYMVCALLSMDDADDMSLDSADALAIGLCHAQRRKATGTGVSRTWEAFVRENPGRVLSGRSR